MMSEEKREDRLSTADLVSATERREEFNEESEEITERDGRSVNTEEPIPLFEEQKAASFHSRWRDIQTRFVDDPRRSVEEADELVAQVVRTIAETFAAERDSLEDQWNRGDEVSTEDLRIAFQRYRSFFNRLLSLET